MMERSLNMRALELEALLAGTKSQFRRPCERQVPEGAQVTRSVTPNPLELSQLRARCLSNMCPFGKLGDRLWVRESWRALRRFDGKPVPLNSPVFYEADGVAEFGATRAGTARPASEMPRWVTRFMLQIVDLRIERVQDIGEADAIAEGCVPSADPANPAAPATARRAYEQMWASIGGVDSWLANPWVWAVSVTVNLVNEKRSVA